MAAEENVPAIRGEMPRRASGEDVMILNERRLEDSIRLAGGLALCRVAACLHVFASFPSRTAWMASVADLAGIPPVGDPESVLRAKITSCLPDGVTTARCAWLPDPDALLSGVLAVLGEGGCGEVVVADAVRSRQRRTRMQRLVAAVSRYWEVRVALF
jgi:hypothetical protein